MPTPEGFQPQEMPPPNAMEQIPAYPNVFTP